MLYRLAAEGVLIVHALFILFVVAGGLLAWRWPWVMAMHLPAALWGAYVELSGRLCPLTDFENALRRRAGEAGFTESFIEHYLTALIYPAGLTRDIQLELAAVVMAVNFSVYGWLAFSRLNRRSN